jgi:hypothetical protein
VRRHKSSSYSIKLARFGDVPWPTAWRGPLWHEPGHQANFFSTLVPRNRVKTGGSHERPMVMHTLVALDSLYQDRRVASRWVICGSRLSTPKPFRWLQHYWDGSRAEMNIAGSPYALQSGSPPGAGR